ncbi:MAG: DUF4114 domain-containing protein [Puniceicoccales bacterium]
MKISLAILPCLAATLLQAQTDESSTLSVQSGVRPFGLDIVAPVQRAASDSASASFQANTLPELNALIDQSLGESQNVQNLSSITLDPSKLVLQNDASVRVYFVGEGAGYHNTLGFNTEGPGIDSGNPQLIFPDASSVDSYYNSGISNESGDGRRPWAPLLPGDFVELGTLEAGTKLDFFLLANGAYGGSTLWSTDESVNADGLVHTVSLAQSGSPYLLIGFEDLYWGGDNDYNDLLFAVDIGVANVSYLANPEPSTWLIMGAFFGVVWALARRQRADSAGTTSQVAA